MKGTEPNDFVNILESSRLREDYCLPLEDTERGRALMLNTTATLVCGMVIETSVNLLFTSISITSVVRVGGRDGVSVPGRSTL